MTILVFILVCVGGMLLSLTVAQFERLSRATGIAALGLALVAAPAR